MDSIFEQKHQKALKKQWNAWETWKTRKTGQAWKQEYHEKTWIQNYNGVKPEVYTRYVDDIFCIFKTEDEAMSFFEYLNNQHVNISFTFEMFAEFL